MIDPLHPQLLKAEVFHGRRGKVQNAFTYRSDYVLFPILPRATDLPKRLKHNASALWSIWDSDFGNGKTSLEDYAHHLIRNGNIPETASERVALLTMPRVLGYSFNPISFWLFKDKDNHLCAVVAEVTNVGRDRHSYLCALPEFTPIGANDEIVVKKCLHVSPFQTIDGGYRFHFDVTDQSFSVRIVHDNPSEDGVTATLKGIFSPLTSKSILASSLRLPFGALRIMTLIHWQALKLKIKGAKFRSRPLPPAQELSR